MKSNFYFLFFYLLLWVAAFIIYMRREKKVSSLGGYLIILYGFGAFASLWVSQQVFYYQSSLFKYFIPSVLPLFYLFAVVLLFATPLFLFKTDKIKRVVLSANSGKLSSAQGKIISSLVALYFFSSIVVFMTILPLLLNMDNLLGMSAGGLDKRAFQSENYAVIFSNKLSLYSYNIWKSLNDVMMCLTFFMLQERKNKIAVPLFLFSCILPILWGLANANRQQSLCAMISVVVVYLLFKNTLAKELNTKIKTIGIGLLIPVVVVFLIISILRFGDHIDFLVYEMVRYFGEAPLNFSSILFDHQQNNLWGICSFPTPMGYTIDARRVLMDRSVGIVSYIFYSFVGNFVIDFGKTFTGLFALFVSCWAMATKLFRSSSGTVHISTVILVQLWANVCFRGIFFFSYLLEWNALIATIMICFILKIKYKPSKEL